MRVSEVKVRWTCEKKSIDFGVESEDRCGEEFETIETLLEWKEGVVNVYCPNCGAFLTQTTDIATVIERGKGKVDKDEIALIDDGIETEHLPVVDDGDGFNGFGYI